MGSKKKGGKVKKSGSKVSHFKLSNKRLTKLAKQGKLKKNLKRNRHLIEQRLKQLKSGKNVDVDNQYSDQEDDELDYEDVEFFSQPNSSFVEGIAKGAKRHSHFDEVAHYEKVPRQTQLDDGPELKPLLPIKNKKGVVARMGVKEEDENPKDDTLTNGNATEEVPVPSEPLPALSTAELFAQRHEQLREVKQRIALLASAVIENPEENTRKLKELRVLLDFQDPQLFITVRKLTMLSLLEVFKDIIPGYRIRPRTEKEKEQSMKQETKKTREFEESLIQNYKLYLQFLERMSAATKVNTTKKKTKYVKEKKNVIPQEAAKALRILAVRCMCDLLVTHPNFNFRSNLITVLVPFMNHKNAMLSSLVCESVGDVFKLDRLGEATLEIVRLINRMVKLKGEHIQCKVLETFLCLKIRESDIINEKESEEKKLNKKQKMLNMSRKERKRSKQMEVLEKELQEAQATVDKKKKARTYTDIIQTVFLVYFRILKTARDSALLPSVLEGLARFAHLINVEFFGDLFGVLNELVESQELSHRESLHCIQTAFTILSGQGAALNIDPMNFYKHLYKILLGIDAAQSNSEIPIVLQCLDSMMIKRKKQVSVPRALAFIKRLSTLTLQLIHHETLGTLAALRQLVHSFPKSDLLYDTETHGSGTFFPELDDPEHCNAHATALYELHTLRRHYHPAVRKYASHLCCGAPSTGNGQLPIEMSRKSPEDLYKSFDTSSMMFNPDFPKEAVKAKIIQVPYGDFVQSSITRDASSVIGKFSEWTEYVIDFHPEKKSKKRTK